MPKNEPGKKMSGADQPSGTLEQMKEKYPHLRASVAPHHGVGMSKQITDWDVGPCISSSGCP